MHGIVFYKSVPAIIENKDGSKEYGDIPCVTYNEITRKFEPVDNPRGNAYATRNRLKFRNKK
jgi:hypothetical protein